jgi:hypothetical protein
MIRRSGRPVRCLCERMACRLAVNASSGTFCCGPPGVSGRRESLAPWWLLVLVGSLPVILMANDPTQEDGEKADFLLRGIRDSLREDLVLSVAACSDA